MTISSPRRFWNRRSGFVGDISRFWPTHLGYQELAIGYRPTTTFRSDS